MSINIGSNISDLFPVHPYPHLHSSSTFQWYLVFLYHISSSSKLLLHCPVFEIKLHPVVRLQFWNSGECGVTPSLLLLSGLFLSRVVVSVRVPSMGQLDFWKLSILDRNTVNHITANYFEIVIWSYTCLEMIILYLNLYNCLKSKRYVSKLDNPSQHVVKPNNQTFCWLVVNWFCLTWNLVLKKGWGKIQTLFLSFLRIINLEKNCNIFKSFYYKYTENCFKSYKIISFLV